MRQLTDLREILQYVPRFRDRLFVIAIDGAIVEEANFRNLLLDIALLRSLRIQVVLVHGGGHQIQRLATQTGWAPSNIDGTGITDDATLELALFAIPRVTHEILEGLGDCDIPGASCNALIAHPAGILKGIDQQHSGRIERVEVMMLRDLIRKDFVPVISPLGCDRAGSTYRLNSDDVAVEVALALDAVKLIYITSVPGIERSGRLLRQLTVEEAEVLLLQHVNELKPSAVIKLRAAARATKRGVPRAHIIDGRVEEGLLAEVFSNEGIGTLIHANEYRAIRQAGRNDVRAIHALIESCGQNDELLRRELHDLENHAEDFYLFEVDEIPMGCGALHVYPDGKAEIACLCVDSRAENQGIGLRLVCYLESLARRLSIQVLFCLSTQAYNFFIHKAGFQLATPDDLPESRRAIYDQSGRRSRVLLKHLD